jgi:hypothetical protein
MSKLEDIEKAVARLAADELEKFRAWFAAFDGARFDEKIERDAQSGKLDPFADQALADFRKAAPASYEAFLRPRFARGRAERSY